MGLTAKTTHDLIKTVMLMKVDREPMKLVELLNQLILSIVLWKFMKELILEMEIMKQIVLGKSIWNYKGNSHKFAVAATNSSQRKICP